jgi:hypothetical protein
MKSYTLDQLAWFNRCLFPDDFAGELRDIGGMDADEASFLKLIFRSHVKAAGKGLNILDIYQEFAINNTETQLCIARVLEDFFKKGEESLKELPEELRTKTSLCRVDSVQSYTLDQLAWFNRCHFPDDFADELHSIGGMDADQAFAFKLSFCSHMKSTGHGLNIVDLYQEYAIKNTELQLCIERVLEDFFKKAMGV